MEDKEQPIAGKKRRFWLAGLMSALAPGLGQIYNGQPAKGVLFFTAELACLALITFTLSERFIVNHFSMAAAMTAFTVAVTLASSAEAAFSAIRLGRIQPGRHNSAAWYIGFFLMAIIANQTALYVWEGKVKPFKAASVSMAPAIIPGDHVLAWLNTGGLILHRGDVIVFQVPRDESKVFMKRIVGLPGEAVEIKSGAVLINGAPLAEPYLTSPPETGNRMGPIRVPEGHIFVLGDTRPNSVDSRMFGHVPLQNVIAKVLVIHWSWEESWSPRWERIGTVLSQSNSLP